VNLTGCQSTCCATSMQSLVTGPVSEWVPGGRFDLITSVHGLHHVGDKLGTAVRVASWLTEDGLFTANFDARSVRPRRPGRWRPFRGPLLHRHQCNFHRRPIHPQLQVLGRDVLRPMRPSGR
jgi:hypothetical protein